MALNKKGDVAQQALVIEYESRIEDEATLNVSVLTATGYHSAQEDTWTRHDSTQSFASATESITADKSIVAVFVEVEANCPDQVWFQIFRNKLWGTRLY